MWITSFLEREMAFIIVLHASVLSCKAVNTLNNLQTCAEGERLGASRKKGESDDPSEEMADILWVLMALANQTGVDLTDALQKSIEKKTKRDATRHINNPKLKE